MTTVVTRTDTEGVVREFVRAVWNGEDPDAIERLTTADFVLHQLVADEDHDREGFVTFQRGMLDALPDFELTIEDMVVDGDDAIALVTLSGTPERPYQALQPTGKSFSSPAFQKYRLEDGQVVEVWVMVDAMGTMRQLGLFPPGPGLVLRMVGRTLKARLPVP